MARDQEKCSSGSDHEGGTSPAKASCKISSYQVMSLTDRIEHNKNGKF